MQHVDTASRRRRSDRLCPFTRLAVVALLSIVATAAGASAQTTYYVSTTGSDAYAGTATQPFRTIQHAANLVNAGDTVVVQDGIYTGTGSGTPCATATTPIVCIARGGTASAPVTFRSQHPLGARLDGQSNTSTDGIRIIGGASYVHIEGFEIYGVGNANGSSSGIELYDGGYGSVISGNHIHDVGRLCTSTSNGEVGIFLEQPYVTITANRIHDIGRFMNGENGCTVSYNASRDHGVYVNGSSSGGSIPGANDAFIADNLFYNNARGWSIQLYPGSLSGLSILNNTFVFANPYQSGQIILGANTTNGLIENNIFYGPKTAAIDYYTGTQTNLVVENNLVYNASLFTSTPGGTTVVGTLSANPLLASTTAPYDFHLTSGSPAIDAGLTESSVPIDFDGNQRTGLYDVGAYEFGSTPTVSTPSITPGGGTFSGSVSVSLADATSGATIHYTTDGTMPGPLSPVYTAPFALTSTANVQAIASASGMTDSAVASAMFSLTSAASSTQSADTTAPAVTITSPANGSTQTKWVTISASASDNVAVRSVAFYVDSTLLATDTSAPYSTSWNARKVSSGAHTLTAVATDTSGNASRTSITVYR